MRIRRRADFQKVYRAGFRVSGRYLAVFARLRSEEGEVGPRLGITASRKVGSAVVRSRCKRRVRELYRTMDVGAWPWPVDLVVNVRGGCEVVPWPRLLEEWGRAMASIRRFLEQGRDAAGQSGPHMVKWPPHRGPS